jgi:hypothetical protein
MIESWSVGDLKKGLVHPNSCRVLVVRGRIPFRCKNRIDIDARRLYPSKDLMVEFIIEEEKFEKNAEGWVAYGRNEKAMEQAYNLTHFEARYRRQILSDSESISLIRRIKTEHQKRSGHDPDWAFGVSIISDWPDKYPIFTVLESLIKSSIGDQ